MGVNLASFPNSRINPTPATSVENQTVRTVPAMAGPPLVIAANPNRTYLEIYNRHATDTAKWKTFTGATPSAASILATGFDLIAGAAYEIDTPQAVAILSTTINPITLDCDEGNG